MKSVSGSVRGSAICPGKPFFRPSCVCLSFVRTVALMGNCSKDRTLKTLHMI